MKPITPIDRLILVYSGAISLAVLLSLRDGPITAWPLLLVAHALMVTAALLAPRVRTAGTAGAFIGELYPLLLLAGLYGEIGIITLNHGVTHDAAIQALELRFFGMQPSVQWIREMPNPLFSWVLHSCYLAYYGILAASPIGLWVSGRRDAARAAVFAIMATFFAHYVVFMLYPVSGPRYFFPLAHNAATAVWPARAAQALLNGADSWGAAFPSSHVAAAVVATGMAWRGWRPLGWALLPLTVGLTLGVVYGQFHYAVDAISGLVAAGVVLSVARVAARRHVAASSADVEGNRPALGVMLDPTP